LISEAGGENSQKAKYDAGEIPSYEVVSKYPPTEQKFIDLSKKLHGMGINVTPIGLKHFEQTFLGSITNLFTSEQNPILKRMKRSETAAPVDFEADPNSAHYTGDHKKLNPDEDPAEDMEKKVRAMERKMEQ
jgi:hypothetical protein